LLSWNVIPNCFPDVFATSKPSKNIVFHVLSCNTLKTIIFVTFGNAPKMALWVRISVKFQLNFKF
jgi:hypothetical protein